MTVATLQDQINVKSDARLRRRIDDKLDPIRQIAGNANVQCTIPARFVSSNPDGSVSMDATILLDALADGYMNLRRDQARQQLTRDFLEKVAQAGIEI